ncbi:hypothetical protein FKP32DRAFT_1548086, partial [Trametes sanguinea]
LVLCNLFDGFDHYCISSKKLVQTFPVTIMDNISLPVLFVHRGNAILCGSDHGEASIFDVKSGSLTDVLRHPG